MTGNILYGSWFGGLFTFHHVVGVRYSAFGVEGRCSWETSRMRVGSHPVASGWGRKGT